MIATTIEQSERLLACGIKKETADMSHIITPPIDREFIEYYDIELRATPYVDSIVWGSECKKPAWSLSVLLTKVLPHLIEKSSHEVCLEYDIDDKEGEHWMCHYTYTNVSTGGDTPIEACVKMVELLHEKNLL